MKLNIRINLSSPLHQLDYFIKNHILSVQDLIRKEVKSNKLRVLRNSL